jgi:alanine racemase
MANSGAVISLPDSYFDMVRTGIMLYGIPPRRSMQTGPSLKPVMSLVSKVAFIKTVEANTSISYSSRYHTTARTQIATIPIGYGDGYSRSLANKAEVVINGKRFPVVGSICMDQIMADVGLTQDVSEGDDVTVMGTDGAESISCWDIAEKLGSIPHDFLSLITSRVERVFTDSFQVDDKTFPQLRIYSCALEP